VRSVKVGMLFFVFLGGLAAHAQVTLPQVNLGFKTTENPQEIVSAIRLVLMLTVLTLAPAILIMMTGFTRILIVFSFLRQAMGVPQLPPNQLLVGLSLFLTFFIMGPAFQEINSQSLQPFMNNKISQDVAIEKGLAPLRNLCSPKPASKIWDFSLNSQK
jgi:flagellar biosynthetic protein FliP